MSFHPQTPQSPSQLSPNSSEPIHAGQAGSATTNTLPTPAHSVNGSIISSEVPGMSDIMRDDFSPNNKRKRSADDHGDRKKKQKVQTGKGRLGIKDLHLDVGPKYLLCKTPHPPSRPVLSDDFLEMYGLQGVAASVARHLPNGEKNSLRKTYKGHIKKLGVQGVWDSVKSDPKAQDNLVNLISIPETEWNVHFVRGKDINDGFNAETRSKLLKATSMGKGLVPKAMWDSSVLGDIAPGKGDKRPSSAKPTAPNTPLVVGTGVQRAKPMTPAAQDVNRPKRNIKKRGHGENTYEGYEGYDDGAETGYSTGEGEAASTQKRVKKTHVGSQKPYAAAQQVRQPVLSSAM